MLLPFPLLLLLLSSLSGCKIVGGEGETRERSFREEEKGGAAYGGRQLELRSGTLLKLIT